MLDRNIARDYCAILREELRPAMGCTEPIAVAYCAATLRELLGEMPERIDAVLSGNILKNVKSVVVPNTGGRKGIRPAIAAGVIAGNAEKALEVISEIPESLHPQLDEFIERAQINVTCSASPFKLDIDLTGFSAGHSARVRITNSHTNIVHKSLDGKVLLELPTEATAEENLTDKSCLNVRDILHFAQTEPLDELAPLLHRQIEYNTAIADEGLKNPWGAQIGRILMRGGAADTPMRAKAYAAAGSDARMSGCERPVVILSGSGNQGMTACLPVVIYARELGVSEEQLLRAVLLSDLISIHQKTGIGRLSAYCGAISAGVGAGAGICYLLGGDYDAIAHTVVNAVAILSGTICDGAKPSCAAKIAAAVDAGILGYEMYRNGTQFYRGEGIVGGCVDATIANVGVLASQGMLETDRTILRIMQQDC